MLLFLSVSEHEVGSLSPSASHHHHHPTPLPHPHPPSISVPFFSSCLVRHSAHSDNSPASSPSSDCCSHPFLAPGGRGCDPTNDDGFSGADERSTYCCDSERDMAGPGCGLQCTLSKCGEETSATATHSSGKDGGARRGHINPAGGELGIA